ncbi:hypothetical protein SAMN02746041_02672 [Desulfacinum hydrothermale DSM 13146]|uniref:4Fe-4S Wbl-type domain-containing protein n=1 Tax=Desulfacinum hydrothermale DSM 13146 TaxID=1121390 RepID=A0A1W1XRH6_9BACT|nr:hypothetical protein [Desulfacinum hydrothermale]SMC26579.1 hypothetical protein SAMN02746041_02672 [Desulfacinum hydrothermale DSM 13146]
MGTDQLQQEGGAPSCYGDAAVVCPKDEDGFIQPQTDCLRCPWVRPCLQEALKAQGMLQEVESPAKEVQTPVGRFLKRWSQRKKMAAGKDRPKDDPLLP